MNSKILYGFVLFLFAVIAACRQNTQSVTIQPAKPTETVSATVTPIISLPDNTKIKTYDGKGTVTKINLELGSVELNHEEIKGLMPAMQMEFYVSDKAMLDNLKVGEAVDFVLEDNAGAERIIKIKKR